MQETVLNIIKISKKYTVPFVQKESFSEYILSGFKRKKSIEKFTKADKFINVLNEVSFSVKKGEAVGIIGKNGAGKSTLLKIISEITEPTSGSIEIKGKIASVLEIGMGFHPDLTGRENIYFSGILLGMKKNEIDASFDMIASFSGIKDFLDTPVKHYSTGMYVRLAFSVVAHVNAEILILDEVLTVGDAEFKYKTYKKIKELLMKGKSILMVSHNLSEILEICTHALILEKGIVKSMGDPFFIASEYMGSIDKSSEINTSNYSNAIQQTNKIFWNELSYAPGNNLIKIKSVSVKAVGKDCDSIFMKDEFFVEIDYSTMSETFFDIAMQIKDISGSPIFTTTTALSEKKDKASYGDYLCRCFIPANFLNEGVFSITLAFLNASGEIFINLHDILFFKILLNENEKEKPWEGRLIGPLRPLLKWETTKNTTAWK